LALILNNKQQQDLSFTQSSDITYASKDRQSRQAKVRAPHSLR